MKAAGIIAEFDPFHNGHRYLISRARESGATHIAVAMSGSSVQRGMPAFCDKFFRAETAVMNGADLVLELPAPYSCSNAEVFARAGVSALAALGEGVVTRLVFGSETDDIGLLTEAAEAADALRESGEVRELLRSGDSYPLAMYKACEQKFGSRTAEVLRDPNSTLALEYCRALRELAPNAEPYAVKRVGAAHGSRDVSNGFASASLLRGQIAAGRDVSDLMPRQVSSFCDMQRLDGIFLYRLYTAAKDELTSLPDVSEAAADVILKHTRQSFSSAHELLMSCKSKNLTFARLRRLALHLVLGVRRGDIRPLPYLRVLAFNDRGRELLGAGEHLLPVSTSLAALERTSPAAARVAELERHASVLRSLGTEQGISSDEYTRQIKILKIEN